MTKPGMIQVLDAKGRFRRRAMLSGLALTVTACAAPGPLIGIAPTRPLTDAEIERRSHRIFITTTRQGSDVPGELYSAGRSARLNFASVDVVIPPTHVAGQIERPRGSARPDPDRHFVVTNPIVYPDYPAYKADIGAAFRAMPRGSRDGMLWIHGYNNTLTDAVLRLAQFVEDSGYPGIPMLYSWASQGKATGYIYDLNSALIARDWLEQVPDLLTFGSIEGLDVVAHSMGNLVAMEAIRGIAWRGRFNTSRKLRNIVLASPDIDIDLFAAQLSRIPVEERNFFVLVSTDDEALALSQTLARRPRLGQIPADVLARMGVNAIDLSQVRDTNSIHHNKFADAPEIVRLLGDRVLAGDSFNEPSLGPLGQAVIVGASGTITVIDEAP
jgi:esterase/lipase superfamily enzyme